MMGYTDAKTMPDAARFAALIAPVDDDGGAAAPRESGQPYPFFLAHQLDHALADFDRAIGAPSTGWSSGSTTASARRSCAAPARCGSGRAAKS